MQGTRLVDEEQFGPVVPVMSYKAGLRKAPEQMPGWDERPQGNCAQSVFESLAG